MSTPDLNLLLVFDAVMHERNLRLAAERLNRSQPAVSQTVARLRDIYADQLFVRTPTGVDPTPRAEQIWLEIREPLAALRHQLAPEHFDPREVRTELRIGLSEDMQALAFPELVSTIRAGAPHIVLRAVDTDHQSVWQQVRSGLIDMGVTVAEQPPKGLGGKVLLSQTFVVVHRADIVPPKTLQEYLARQHVAVGFSHEQAGYTDLKLEALGGKRNVIAWTPRFAAIYDLVVRTGAIATMPKPTAMTYMQSGGVGIAACPFELPAVPVRLVWHLRRQSDALNRWARAQVEQVVRGLCG